MAKRNKNGLTDLQQAFADAYLKQSLNERSASAAYKTIRPKATPATAKVQGPRMLTKACVAEYVDERTEKIIDDVEAKQLVSHADIVQELMHVGFGRLTNVIRVDDDGNVWPKTTEEWDESSKASLKTLEMQNTEQGEGKDLVRTQKTKMVFNDKLKALDMLARYLNMYKEDQEAGSDGGLVILPADLSDEEWVKQVKKQKEK